jgi:Arc/MetJ-type ribon-helix-helix transcriptional regulator
MMIRMKVSVSLPPDDVAFLDRYATRENLTSRSAALHQAIDLLRNAELEDMYAEAWAEWESGPDSGPWSTTTADGLDAPG